MQFAKDSFSMALWTRLASLNPGRTITLAGVTRPALIVLENELPTPSDRLAGCFYLEWGAIKPLETTSNSRALCGIDCTISYHTNGTTGSGVDRGRVLGELDRELFAICEPEFTRKLDFSQSPSVDLGTGVFWTVPSIAEREVAAPEPVSHSARREHSAQLTVFFFPEVTLP